MTPPARIPIDCQTVPLYWWLRSSYSIDEGAIAAAREDLVQELFRVLPEHLKSEPLLAYFEGAIGMEQTLRSKMTSLPSAEFEAILHPVFKEDEWKLIAVGGALGVAIGCLQAFFLN